MSLIDPTSCDCVKSELELFETKGTQTAIDSTKIQDIHPTVSISQTDTLQFSWEGGNDEYLDLQQSTLYISGKIVADDGTALTEKTGATTNQYSKVYPVNYPIASFFKSLEVWIGGKLIGSSSNLYPYRAYLETVLSYGRDAKENQLRASGFYKDKDPMDAHDDATFSGTSKNKGATARFKLTKYSKLFELEGKLHHEMFNQPKLLLSKTPVMIKLQKADPKFFLVSKVTTKNYKLVLEKALFRANVKSIAPYVREAHEARLKEVNAKYPVVRSELKFYTRAAAMSDLSEPNIINGGELPRRVIIGLLSTQSFNGSIQGNPFNFKNFKARSVKLKLSSRDSPYGEIELDYENDIILPGYMTLFRATNMWGGDHSNHISPDDYKNGYALYCWNLTGDESDGNSFQLAQSGTLGVEIKLDEASTETITILCYMEYDSILEINEHREVFYNGA